MRTGGYKCGYLIFPLLRTVVAQVRVYDHGPQKWNKKKSKNHFYNPAGSFKKPIGSLKSLK
jgi:hypothetical protein